MTNEELRDALIRHSKRSGFSIVEIDYIVRMIVQADNDPLPPVDWGEPFDFPTRKVSIFDDEYDFNCINSLVPKPNAQVDRWVAEQKFGLDLQTMHSIYANNPKLSIEQDWRLLMQQWDWFHFWSVRHPDAKARANYARLLRRIEAIAKPLTDKAAERRALQ